MEQHSFDGDHGSTPQTRSHGSLQSGFAGTQITEHILTSITDPKWNCKCVCCYSMRSEYAKVAQQQIVSIQHHCDEMARDRITENAQLKHILKYNQQLIMELHAAKDRIEFLESLKEWRDFTNLGH